MTDADQKGQSTQRTKTLHFSRKSRTGGVTCETRKLLNNSINEGKTRLKLEVLGTS